MPETKTIPETKNTSRSRDFDADITLGPDATIGDKVKALRLSQKITMTELARACEMSDRAIRYIENNEKQPSVETVKRLAAALGVGTDFFMDDELFQKEMDKELTLEEVKQKYGSRGKAQAKKIYEQTQALFAGGQLSEEDTDAFRDLMMELFFETKEEAKKFTPKKYR